MPLGESLIDFIARNENGAGLALIGFCAFIEYIFPPFPGDMVVVFGSFLVARRGWSAPGVFGAVLVGSAAGCMLGWAFGRWLHRRESAWRGWLARARPRIDRIVERFSRHGALYITINRFLPSVRALFFVAAGMAGLVWWKVLLAGVVSAALWNLLLFTLGGTVGREWPRLVRIITTYSQIAWALVAVVLLVLAARWAIRRAAR
jgi:membrane-associated protein